MYKYILLFFIAIIGFGLDGSGVWEGEETEITADSSWAYAEATDSFATSKLKADFIAPDDSGQIEFLDNVIFDSTLHIAIVHYAVRIKPYNNLLYYSFSATTGSGTAVGAYPEELPINYHNLDSIQIDSIRWGGLFYGDSIAIYQLYLKCYEETDTSITQIAYINSGDSLYVPDGSASPQWASKVFTAQGGTSIDVWNEPFFTHNISFYWHNRANAAANILMYPPLVYLTAFYSK
jgi:hypothetical protein